ncbi:hypothetical protein J2S16_000968 [Cytobacillus kochii]|nr:hypothetical protein [Cytobacillus kochii]
MCLTIGVQFKTGAGEQTLKEHQERLKDIELDKVVEGIDEAMNVIHREYI